MNNNKEYESRGSPATRLTTFVLYRIVMKLVDFDRPPFLNMMNFTRKDQKRVFLSCSQQLSYSLSFSFIGRRRLDQGRIAVTSIGGWQVSQLGGEEDLHRTWRGIQRQGPLVIPVAAGKNHQGYPWVVGISP
jgi:hypothetical protein